MQDKAFDTVLFADSSRNPRSAQVLRRFQSSPRERRCLCLAFPFSSLAQEFSKKNNPAPIVELVDAELEDLDWTPQCIENASNGNGPRWRVEIGPSAVESEVSLNECVEKIRSMSWR